VVEEYGMAPQRKKAKTAAYASEAAAALGDPAINPELAAVKMDPALLHPDLAAASAQMPASQATELSPESISAIAAAAAAATRIPDATTTTAVATATTTTTPATTATGKQPRQRKNAAPASRAAVEAAAALHQQLESTAAELTDLAKQAAAATTAAVATAAPHAEESTVSVDAAAEFLRTIQERESQKNLLALQAQQQAPQQHIQHTEPLIAADGSIPTDLASLYPRAVHAQASQPPISYSGFPTAEQFADMVHEYLSSLSPKKQTKALLTQAMYDDIREVLLHPTETKTGSAQFRFWSKKMFKLVSVQSTHIVIHENKPVAVKEQLYDVLVECHGHAAHGGRDKTAAQVRKYYSWVPKELIARFVKGCPSCVRNTSPNS